MLCCFALFVCLTLLASFFLPSHLSLKTCNLRLNWLPTQQTLVATRGSFSRPAASPKSKLSRHLSLSAASGIWSHTLPMVQAAVSCTCTVGSFIREMSISIRCVCVCVRVCAEVYKKNSQSSVNFSYFTKMAALHGWFVYTCTCTCNLVFCYSQTTH